MAATLREFEELRGDFLFTGMIRCGHCGCALVGDIKKEKYIYYRCSHGKGKCPEPYVREEWLLEQFETLDRVSLSSEMFEWLRAALRESFAHVHKEHDDAVLRLQKERERLRERLKQIYMDNLDGRIEDEVHNALTIQFRDQERKVAKELERRHDADLSYFDDGIALLSVARDSKQRFLAADLSSKNTCFLRYFRTARFATERFRRSTENPLIFL